LDTLKKHRALIFQCSRRGSISGRNTFISRPVFWRIYVSLLGAAWGLCAFLFYAGAADPVRLLPSWENAPLILAIATTFAGIHLIAGHIGARWLIRSSGLFDARHVKVF